MSVTCLAKGKFLPHGDITANSYIIMNRSSNSAVLHQDAARCVGLVLALASAEVLPDRGPCSGRRPSSPRSCRMAPGTARDNEPGMRRRTTKPPRLRNPISYDGTDTVCPVKQAGNRASDILFISRWGRGGGEGGGQDYQGNVSLVVPQVVQFRRRSERGRNVISCSAAPPPPPPPPPPWINIAPS